MEVDNEEALNHILVTNESVLALFYASWCPFCRRFLPIFQEQEDRLNCESISVNIDDLMNPLWETYDIQVVPTVIYFRKEIVTRRLDGVLGIGLSRQQLETFLHMIKSD